MPGDAKPRWITVRKPFDYHWPGRSAITTWREADLGEHLVKAEVADFAVAGGYATEGRLDRSARSRKGTGAKRRTRRKKDAPPGKAADNRSDDAVVEPGVAVPDRTADRSGVDQDAG